MAARTETPGNHYLPLNQQHRHIPGAPPQSYALYPVVKHRRKTSLTPSSPSSSPRPQQPPSYHSLTNTYADPSPQSSSSSSPPKSTQHRSETHLNGREATQQYTQSTAAKGHKHNKSSSSSSSNSSPIHRDHSSQSTKENRPPQQSSSRSEKSQTKFSPPSSVSLSGSRAPNRAIIADKVKDTKSAGNTSPEQRQHQQRQQQPHFGGGVPRQPALSTKTHGQSQGEGEHPRLQGQTPLTSTHNRGQGVSQHHQQQQPATLSTLNTGVPRQGSASTTPTSPSGSVKPELVTAIPTSSLCLSFDEDYEGDQVQDLERHQRQALQYQQKLQQKPPKKRGEWDSDDDDSDSGSVVAYRRSIQRLSVSYNTKGRAGIPNISLFGPNHRPNPLVKHDRSGSGASGHLAGAQIMVKEQREDRMRQQREKDRLQEQQQQQLLKQQQPMGSKTSPNHGHSKSGTYGSSSSLASIDERPRQEDGRPRMVRANTANSPPTQRTRDVQVPERSTSADNIYYQNGSNRPRQGSQGSHQYHRDQQQRNGGQPGSPSLSSMQVIRGQYEPRPSHESSQSQRSNYSRGGKQELLGVSTKDYRQGAAGTDPTPSRSPSRGGALSPVGGGQSFRKGSTGSTRSPGGYGPGPVPPGMLNMHPAHHHPSNGYVRPEEAVGPSNPMPEKAEDYVRKGIEFHELGEISKATHYFRTAAEIGDPVGMLMYGLSVRHGWGCTANRVLAFQYLQKSAEHAVGDLNSRDSFTSTAAKGELVLAIYELGICFRHGWGVDKDKKTAAYYFEIAADLGDPDAQNDLAWCYYHGIGVKKDMFKSAKYYRLAAAQGQELIGNSWIWKDKYGGPTSPTVMEKGQAQSSSIRA
ncbi:hypothetical protein BGZ72_010598 [Mortierella alpina]|nr:hypothetical protein BGZ72_010598 [Mortierella alpina]